MNFRISLSSSKKNLIQIFSFSLVYRLNWGSFPSLPCWLSLCCSCQRGQLWPCWVLRPLTLILDHRHHSCAMSAAWQRLFKNWQMTREKHNIYVSEMLHPISSWQRLHLIISESLVAHIEVRHQTVARGFWLFESAVYSEDKTHLPGGRGLCKPSPSTLLFPLPASYCLGQRI